MGIEEEKTDGLAGIQYNGNQLCHSRPMIEPETCDLDADAGQPG